MKSYEVRFSSRAAGHLQELWTYIATEAAPRIADEYLDDLVEFCESLQTFPMRGTVHNDLRKGLRTIGFRRRVTVAFRVEGDEVTILAVLYGGKSLEKVFRVQ